MARSAVAVLLAIANELALLWLLFRGDSSALKAEKEGE